MKTSWSEQELRKVISTIRMWVNSRKFTTMHYGVLSYVRTVPELEYLLGLPYTSSGRAACVGITNTELYLDDSRLWVVYCFEMDDYGVIYAVCHDRDDNEILIPINK